MADELTEKIIAAAIEVHKTLGSGLLESIYEEALCIEFSLAGIPFQRQVAVDVVYKGHVIQGQRLDLLVNDDVVLEIKSLRALPDIATAQLLSYLKATRLNRGLLINFGEKQLVSGIKRISLCSLWQMYLNLIWSFHARPATITHRYQHCCRTTGDTRLYTRHRTL